jgi:hypothetical protein
VESSKFFALMMLLVVLALLVIVWFYPPTGDFRVDNPFWNGLSTFDNQPQVVSLSSLGYLPSSGKETALLIVPYVQLSEVELSQVRNYVSSGGILVLSDDYGFGNQVLDGLGLNMRFSGQPLLDPLFDYRNKWLPKITDFVSTPLAANVSSIIFNHATALSIASDASVVAYSSSFSFLDANENGIWDSGELTGPFPVVAYATVGQGYVIAIADPSLFINSMINLDDNLQFTSNVFSIESGTQRIFVDQAHLPETPLDEAKMTLALVYGVVTSPIGTLSLIIVILALSLKPIWRSGEKHGEKP